MLLWYALYLHSWRVDVVVVCPLPAFLEGGCCCGMPFTCIPGGWMLLWYALYLHSWRVDVVVLRKKLTTA